MPGLLWIVQEQKRSITFTATIWEPQTVTDENGNIVWMADYMPFGEVSLTTAAVENNFRFPGQYFDEETGLHYNWHRYYDAGTGRYLRSDPIGLEGGMNLYSYVSNNPITRLSSF